MKVSTINLFCWLGSLVLTAALGLVIYKYWGKQEALARPFDSEYVKALLSESRPVVSSDQVQLDYAGRIQPHFIGHNWTGKPEEKKVVVEPTAVVDTGPKFTSAKELIAVKYVQYDTDDPGGSAIFVKYIGALESHGTEKLKVGDQLPKPHDGVVIHEIDPEWISFSFAEEGRENEKVFLNAFGDMELISQVGEDGVITAKKRPLPTAKVRTSTAPAETQRLANGNFQIGTEDAQAFANDYQRILTQDMRVKTHYDENGQRAGIEIVEVKPGSIAARHGAQAGDVVISVNGHPVSSEQEAIKWAKNNADKYSVWEVVIENKGQLSTKVFKSPDN